MLPRFVLPVLIALLLPACSEQSDSNAQAAGPGGRNRGPAEVGFVIAQPTSVTVTSELPGRTSASQVSEVRPQVSGVIRARQFTEGSYVRAGQTLYQIDPSAYRADASEARAAVSVAEASRQAAAARAARSAELARSGFVSKSADSDTQGAAREAAATVQQRRAALRSAEISVGFTRVPAPISGRIGRSAVTTGALVTANQTDTLATIQKLDPMFVDVQQSSAQLLELRRALATSGRPPSSTQIKLKLEDGSDYGYSGTLQFAEALVDPSTGTVTLRATVPNPQNLLLPGMFVRALVTEQTFSNIFLVPQAAVSRDPLGRATLFVVGAGNKAVRKTVTADRTSGSDWIVTGGLAPGDKIITEGLGKVKPDGPVKPVPAGSPPSRPAKPPRA